MTRRKPSKQSMTPLPMTPLPMKQKGPVVRQQGFTLLEVVVALTITGMVLGSLFALAGGSKQLAFRSGESLHAAIEARAAINFALLQDEYRDVEEILEGEERFAIRADDYLDFVPRKTQQTIFKLQSYVVIDEETDEAITGTRWVKLELPE
ncbi:MAG: type II secretion system protein [Gammaproteobacteria bacterium]|nr:type II secretion system protein [Gammaproteobacteria bacterium]